MVLDAKRPIHFDTLILTDREPQRFDGGGRFHQRRTVFVFNQFLQYVQYHRRNQIATLHLLLVRVKFRCVKGLAGVRYRLTFAYRYTHIAGRIEEGLQKC